MSSVGRLYKIVFQAVSISAQQTLLYCKPAADKICVIEYVTFGVAGVAADAGDAQEELYDVVLKRLNATVSAGSGGGSFTPVAQLINDAAAGATGRINDTSKASGTTSAVVHADTMNSRNPFLWYPKDTHEEYIANAGALVLELDSTPGDAFLGNGTMAFRELP